MKWFNLDTIKNSSIYITPNLPVIATKRYKVSLLKAFLYTFLYTVASWLVLILILSSTPLKDMLFIVDNSELHAQNEKIQKLQSKVLFLTQELENISSTNERIKYAIRLAQKDSSDNKNAIYDSLKKPITKKIKIEGSILTVFNDLYEKLFQENSTKDKIFFMEPAQGIIIQEYAASKGHLGIDYGIKSGSPVFAALGGLITFADYTVDSGFMIMIQHSNSYISVYKHCSVLLKKTRDIVAQGEMIALSGNSGKNTTGPHLHFEIWENGRAVDPQTFLIK